MVSVTSRFGNQASNQANGLLLKTKSSVADSKSGRGGLPANANTNPVVAALLKGAASSNDPLAKPLSDEQQKANDTIRTLSQAKKQFVADRKAAALQKLEQARTKLRLLRSLGGDPKTIAREAKRIAQEISAAAREYGAAVASEGGGGASALAGQSVAAPVAPAAPATNESGSPASGTEATAGSTPEAAAGLSAQTVTSAAEATSTNEKSSVPTSESKDSKADSDANPTARASTESDTDAARQKTAQAYQDAAAKTAAKFAQARGERDVLEKFKEAAREVKRLIEEAARKLRAEHANDLDAAEAKRAASETDQAVQDLGDAIHAQQIDTGGADGAVAIGAATVDAGASVAINILS